MKTQWKKMGVISIFFALIVLLGSFSLSQALKVAMHQKGMVSEMKGNMDRTMG